MNVTRRANRPEAGVQRTDRRDAQADRGIADDELLPGQRQRNADRIVRQPHIQRRVRVQFELAVVDADAGDRGAKRSSELSS